MIAAISFTSLLGCAAFAAAGPVVGPRAVASLNEEATAEAHQRDNGATRAFSNVQIKTSDGRCLFVDKLSGDFRANLTPVQIGNCGATDGQGWDIITAGKHIKAANSMLVVSTLTNACFNFDPRRAAGNQVNLFSCGGRADGGGDSTTSQVYTFNGGAGPLALEPANQKGSCLTVKGNVLDIAKCNTGDAKQSFTLGGAAAGGGRGGKNNGGANGGGAGKQSTTAASQQAPAKTNNRGNAAATSPAGEKPQGGAAQSSKAETQTREQGKGKGKAQSQTAAASVATTAAAASQSAAAPDNASVPVVAPTGKAVAIANPTTPVAVSRAGGKLNPTAAAQSHQRDEGATRAFSNVEIRAPNGQCLFIDPTAGDFRQNLIPVQLVDCSGTPNEKWDIITKGKHNDQAESALIVSSLTNGCISQDGRRAQGDTVTLFSCGGRADGEGGTNSGQLVRFIGALSFAFAPKAENGKTCVLPGNGRLDSGPCPTDGSQLFSIFP